MCLDCYNALLYNSNIQSITERSLHALYNVGIVAWHEYTCVWPTHCMHIFKDLLHSDQLVVEFVIGAGVRKERVPVSDEQVEDLHHLK